LFAESDPWSGQRNAVPLAYYDAFQPGQGAGSKARLPTCLQEWVRLSQTQGKSRSQRLNPGRREPGYLPRSATRNSQNA